ncbi:uncharacterized protein LOC142326279 isoform X1 [Lycorma delicatula]|uniref:uncharacterized protein LOC142326279 isoform X1 n=1 Tax=Lycorma delicatula TaxID=130591 RepID=UPI003F5195A4
MWLLGVLLLSVTTINCDEDWSWGGNSKKKTEESLNNNTLIDNLLLSGRTGRHLDGFDEVYSDPEIQQALSTGNDSQARHYIKERLCGLGLMACDEDIEEKRPHVRPSDLIYAQPVHLRPVGHPITAIPVKGSPLIGSGGYGPPRPIPLASNSYGSSLRPPAPPPPPPRLHYGPPRGPVYSVSKPAAVFEREPEFHYRPPVTSTIDDKKPVVVVNTQQPGGNVQQHVHHHFHHDADKGLTSNTGVTASPIETIGINTDSISYPPLSSNYNPAFIPTGSGSGSSSLYGNSISGSNYASSYDGVNSYGGIGPFYKKKFNVHKGGYNTNGILASSSTYNSNSYPKYETPRADGGFNDCICVPYEQCPPHEIARKEDGYFIDPRTVSGSTIEALGPDEVVITDGNGTMTVVSKHTKREDNEHFDEDSSSDTELNEKAAEDKNIEPETSSKRKRREAAQDTTENKNIKPRKFGLGGGSSDDDSDSSGLKLRPTFGVSFGLPSGGGGYPLNPFYPNPAVNPYGGSVGGNGVDLGLVSVNPLLSVQVTKDEYGEKVVKPLVNLHVTPNQGFVHKIGNIFHKFKDPLYYGPPPLLHHHQHYHTPAYPPPHYKPHPPPYYHKPWGPPGYSHYAPSYQSYRQDKYQSFAEGYNGDTYSEPIYDGSSQPPYDSYSNNGYPDNGYDDSYDSYYRSASNISTSSSSSDVRSPSSNHVQFPSNRRSDNIKFIEHRSKRETDFEAPDQLVNPEKRQANYGFSRCPARQVCCRRPLAPPLQQPHYRPHPPTCGQRNTQGINGRIKNPVYVDGDSEFGEYPWQVAILKKDPQESVYVCGGTLIDNLHIITAAHCVKSYGAHDLRVRLGEWDVNHDVEFYPYIERDVQNVFIHPEFYAGTLYNDLAVIRIDRAVDFTQSPHISPACLPEPYTDYSGQRCWTTGWGKDAFGDYGKYQNILKEVDVPIVSFQQCQLQLQQTRLGYEFKLHPGFVCAGGEEGKDACKGDGGGPMVCERNGSWQVVGVVSWGIGCGQYGVPGVYVKVAHYLDWIKQITNQF